MPKVNTGQWSSTAASNTDVGGVNIDEGTAASNVNNGMREIMAQIAERGDDLDGYTATGTDTYAVTTSCGYTAYSELSGIVVIFTNANTGAATLNVDSIGAAAIKKNGGAALAAGDIPAGGTFLLTHDGTDFEIVGKLTGDSPQFTSIELGHETDTTITRTGAGDIAVEGNALYRAGGTDVPVADGGTGASTAATALTNLGAAAATKTLQVFTASGTYTKPAGLQYALVIATGSGGGGAGADCTDSAAASAGGGGGAGATSISLVAAGSIASSETVTIGAGGGGGSTSAGAGSSGSASSLGSLVVARGGNGGFGVSTSTLAHASGGASSGTVSCTGDIEISGGGGLNGFVGINGTDYAGAGGGAGASYWGGGGKGGALSYTTSALERTGEDGTAPGSGGGGAVATNGTTGAAGGAGADGIVMVLEFY